MLVTAVRAARGSACELEKLSAAMSQCEGVWDSKLIAIPVQPVKCDATKVTKGILSTVSAGYATQSILIRFQNLIESQIAQEIAYFFGLNSPSRVLLFVTQFPLVTRFLAIPVLMPSYS